MVVGFNMATYTVLLSRVSLPYTFGRSVPKISWIRNLSSESSGNGNRAKLPVSSLLEKLKSSSTTKTDLVKLSDELSTEPLAEETPSSRKRKTGLKPMRANTKKWKYNESLRKVHVQEDTSLGEKSLGTFESGKLLGSLKEAGQEPGQDDAKSMLENSIEETRSRRNNAFQRIVTSTSSESIGIVRRRPKKVRRSLEELDKSQHMQEDTSLGEESLGITESGKLLGSLKEAGKEPGQDDVKSMLEKSIKKTRSQRNNVFRRIATSTSSESIGIVRPRPQRVEKSLEELDKSRLNAAELSKQNVDPSLNQKIKDLLSEVQIQPKQLGTAKTIVAAVENWGTSANHQRKTLKEEHEYQIKEMSSMKRPRGFMRLEGESTGLFDDVISKAKTADAKINNVTESNFLYHLEELDNVDKIGFLGVKRNAFAGQISLSNRLWQYPIDNEVCKTEEENTSFEEHVFLEYLLDDFPSKGPVRRFMELVINGLQKNPYLTVEQKKERVRWFHDYFSNFSEEELSF